MTSPAPLLIDTDCGCDDAVAIVTAIGAPEVTVALITSTWGNCAANVAARNARWVVEEVCGARIDVIEGSPAPAGWKPTGVHGPDGLGGTLGAAVDPGTVRARHTARADGAAAAIASFARTHAGRGRLLCIGPLTNLAAALTLEPALADLIDRAVLMAGLPTAGGVAVDTNVDADAAATAAVAESGLRCTWVGIPHTSRILLSESDFDGPRGRMLLPTQRYYAAQRASTFGYSPDPGPRWRVPAHDAVAAAVAIDPTMAVTQLANGRHQKVAALDETSIRDRIRVALR